MAKPGLESLAWQLLSRDCTAATSVATDSTGRAMPTPLIGLTKSLSIPEMEQLLLADINAGDNEMRELAGQRAEMARNWLIEHGGIPGERIFVLEPKVEVEADAKKFGGKVEFSLR